LTDAPPLLLIEFAAGSSLDREQDRPSQLPIYRNGPPGTFVRLGNVRISLPTDQIVRADECNAGVIVEFGGMRFTGVDDDRITFDRVRDLWPERELSPARSWKMTLDRRWVASIHENGLQVWPVPARQAAAR
jgi:hypothetical protein